ncbi:DnaJ domain-containing protein [Daldinia caldariorum]|uniref:DnaJ domain-containing protein n=1 Tax=Daldinia caldariorum TaxID=326644 RepID=UPI00200782CA|nr:DnaJ domain-containing protein [Daldinia caldariorum]KAI1463685.1 DnaJ domain-containing protein [Daldinia caldariorum]
MTSTMSDEGLERLPPNLYEILGVLPTAELPEIRSAHRKLILKCHPDKYQDPELKEQKRKEFNRVRDAYEILSNDTERTRYDIKVKSEAELAKMELKATNLDCAILEHNISILIDLYSETEQQFHNEEYPAPGKGVSSGILVARGRIDGTRTYAIPDTGAECNIITAFFASTLKLRIKRHREGEEVRLLTANGRYMVTRGTTEVNWQFASEAPRTFRVTFHVLEEFMYNLVLGNAFLMETKTMSHHKGRLSRIPRPTNALSVLRVNLLGQTSQRVRGHIRTSDVLALPDSGSEPNLVSWKFVTENGLETLINWNDRRLLQFADGSLAKTEGSIRTQWRFASRYPLHWSTRGVKFHVSHDCIYDVIIGQNVLMETDAFLYHSRDFVRAESDPEFAGMNLVIFAPKKLKKSALSPRADDAIYSELQRRARADNEERRAQNDAARSLAEARRGTANGTSGISIDPAFHDNHQEDVESRAH